VQVKAPSDVKEKWDNYMVKETIPADEAFQPLSTSKSRLVGQSEARAEFANLYRLTRPAVLDRDRAKAELNCA